MKTTIEEINGKLCTVVWYEAPLGYNVKKYRKEYPIGVEAHLCSHNPNSFGHVATALPALPKHPKPKHAQLLYRYMAEGLHAAFTDGLYIYSIIGLDMFGRWIAKNGSSQIHVPQETKLQITHAISSETGERVDVAIEEGE